jgi:hypothetical protein
MKNVFSRTEEVSHLFASKSHTSARSGNVFIRDSMIFSYGEHYCVARHLKDDYVALNLEGSSPTTEGHKREVRAACSHLKVIKVFDPMCGPDRASTERHIQGLTEQAACAKPNGRRPLILADMRQVISDYNTYCKLEGKGTPIDQPTLSDEEIAKIKAAQKEENKRVKAQRDKRNAELAEMHARQIEEWLAGDRYSLHYDHGETLLRIRTLAPNGEAIQSVQTSRGAQIPVSDAKRLWPIILRTKDGARDYEVGMQLGSYRLTKINRDGSIVVGCHQIGFDQIEKIAGQLGLLEEVMA